MFDRNTPIEKWCELCDALQVPPDAPIDNVILKAKRLREMAHQNNEELVEAAQYAIEELGQLVGLAPLREALAKAGK